MFSERNSELLKRADEYFFDRDSQLFRYILNYYRSGIVAKPAAVPRLIWEQELVETLTFHIMTLFREKRLTVLNRITGIYQRRQRRNNNKNY